MNPKINPTAYPAILEITGEKPNAITKKITIKTKKRVSKRVRCWMSILAVVYSHRNQSFLISKSNLCRHLTKKKKLKLKSRQDKYFKWTKKKLKKSQIFIKDRFSKKNNQIKIMKNRRTNWKKMTQSMMVNNHKKNYKKLKLCNSI